MVDLVHGALNIDASSVNTLLLLALLTSLKYIGHGLMSRVKDIESKLNTVIAQHHTHGTRIAVIESQLNMRGMGEHNDESTH